MSKSDVKRLYLITVMSPVLVVIAVILAFEKADENSLLEYFCWALAGMMLVNCFLMPALIYGYHNRHHIIVHDEEAFDFGPAVRGALIGTAAVPFARALFDWLSSG